MLKYAFRQSSVFSALSVLVLSLFTIPGVMAASNLGIFESQSDIGTVLHPGSAIYDSKTNTYTVSGSGENTWFTSDDFHFVWKKASGDISIAADVVLAGDTGVPHRKAMLMIRQSLDPDSPYVDIAKHGVGKTSLQFRDASGAITHTIASHIYNPRRIELKKQGDFYYAFVSGEDGRLRPMGASTRLQLTVPFYVGFGVCAHEKGAVQKAIFSHVEFRETTATEKSPGSLYSTLETISVRSGDRQVEYVAPGRFEAPNWSRDGLFFVFNKNGDIFRIPVKCGAEDTGCGPETEPVRIATNPAIDINDNHGISPNGQIIAVSGQRSGKHHSSVYLLPIVGGHSDEVTRGGSFDWHGWSPDGKILALTSGNSTGQDIYTIPADGGEVTRLTASSGVNDGPEFSPDGKYVYFSSNRSGLMQIWRMRTDGTEQERVVSGANNDWFPHVSPDGQWLAFLSYDGGVAGHPVNRDVTLTLMSLKNGKVRTLASLLGGEGTINSPSWSPDSSKVAFVSYSFIPVDGKKKTH